MIEKNWEIFTIERIMILILKILVIYRFIIYEKSTVFCV